MLFSCVVLESSALLSSPSVVSMDCPICCCSSWRALSELSGSAVRVATSLSTSCTVRFTVSVPVSLEVSINASLLFDVNIGFLRFCLLLTLSLPSCLLRFGGVDDGGVDPFAGVLAMVEKIPFDDVVMLCFCWDVCFFVWLSRSVCLLAYDSCQLEFYVACHQRGGVGRISMNESSTEEKWFLFFQKIQLKIWYLFYVLLWQKISYSGINTLSLQPTCRTGDSILVPRKPSVFFGCLCRLIVVHQSFQGILKVTLLTPFSHVYVERTEKENESSTVKKECISSKDPLEDTDHT